MGCDPALVKEHSLCVEAEPESILSYSHVSTTLFTALKA